MATKLKLPDSNKNIFSSFSSLLYFVLQVVGVQFDRKDIPMNKLVATTLESKIYCFDTRTQHPKKGFAQVMEKGHDSTVWSVKHLPQNRELFMTTGGSGTLCLWK